MLVEEVFIQSIKIKNIGPDSKEIYLVVQIDENSIISKVRIIQSGDTVIFTELDLQQFSLGKAKKAKLRLLDYEAAKEVQKFSVFLNKITVLQTSKFFNKNFEVQIFLKSKQVNSLQGNDIKKFLNEPRYSLPTLKRFPSDRNSVKRQYLISNESFDILYPSFQPSRNSFVQIEQDVRNETSLEKMINYEKKSSKFMNQKISTNLIHQFENKNLIKATNTMILFDDYEARPKQICKKLPTQNKRSRAPQQRKNLSKQVDSTENSSIVKKNLKNAITTLISNPSGVEFSQKSQLKGYQNISRQFFDYGLVQSKRTHQYSKLQLEEKINKSSENSKSLQILHDKKMAKQQMKKVAKMNFLELSRSIFEHYGLDLSLSNAYTSKSFEKSKDTILDRSINKQMKRHNKSRQSKDMVKKSGKKIRQEKNIYDKNVQDYRQEKFLTKKVYGSKRLHRMERPK